MKKIFEFDGRLFVLYRQVQITDKIDTTILKQFWHCDTCLKKNGYYFFCNEIKPIDYEEITDAGGTTPDRAVPDSSNQDS